MNVVSHEFSVDLMIIKNLLELSQKGNAEGRRLVLDVAENALQHVNSYNLIRNFVKLENELRIGTVAYDLEKMNNFYVVGGGKQVTYVASALEEVLGERIRDGIVVEKRGWGCRTKRIRVVEGGHPIPDSGSVKGAREIVKIAKKVTAKDLVIVCVTGGCTSLTTLPPRSLTLRDVAKVHQLLLRSGAPIEDVNTVRKHLSQLGGGKLSLLMQPAEIVSLIAMDEVPGLPWGPTVPDTTTFSDAINVLVKLSLWNRIPESVKRYFNKADPLEETPKSREFEEKSLRVHNLIFADNGMLCKYAQTRSEQLGVKPVILSTVMEGEAREVGTALASIAKEIEKNSQPFNPPCIIIVGGETTVKISGRHGEGGRNQELALSAALKISGSETVVIASIGTDGTDGPTDIAGGIVDGFTVERAKNASIDLEKCLSRHDSSHAFRKLEDAIYTNDTGTNLMDLIIMYIGK